MQEEKSGNLVLRISESAYKKLEELMREQNSTNKTQFVSELILSGQTLKKQVQAPAQEKKELYCIGCNQSSETVSLFKVDWKDLKALNSVGANVEFSGLFCPECIGYTIMLAISDRVNCINPSITKGVNILDYLTNFIRTEIKLNES